MRVDAHQHFWKLDRGDYGWLTPQIAPIHRDFLPGDLAATLTKHAIGRTILVQAAPTVAETHFLLDLAAQTPFVAGVVGWIDLANPDAVRQIEELSAQPLLLGLRPMLQDLPDDAWILNPALAPAISAMIAHGLRLDALVKPRHLHLLHRFLNRWPALPVVVDHGAKPEIGRRAIDDWERDLRVIAAQTEACCKLSGLLTEAGPDATAADIRPYVEILLDAFGPERLMWGSDWPVLELAADYDRWLAIAEELTSHLNADEKAALFGGTAANFYGISQ